MKFTDNEIALARQLQELGVRFEPPDDWHGAYYVFHQDKVFPWAQGEDKPNPFLKLDQFVWLPTISDCIDWLREKGAKDYLYHLHNEAPLEALLKAMVQIAKDSDNG